jgi:DNA-binding transcriptional ArsR family regulator
MNEYEKILKAFANKRRLCAILYVRKKKAATVGDIAGHLRLSFKATSKHLAVLYAVGIVEREQRSLSCYYSFSTKAPTIANMIIDAL